MSDEVGRKLHYVFHLKTVIPVSVTTNATAYTITAGKGLVILQNTGSQDVWMGDEDVDPSSNRGYKILPNHGYEFREVTDSFKVYFATSTSTSTISIVEG